MQKSFNSIKTNQEDFVKIFIEPNSPTEYYIYYKFTQRDTDTNGRYEGEFLIRTDSGIIILPITEKLFINIGEKFVID